MATPFYIAVTISNIADVNPHLLSIVISISK